MQRALFLSISVVMAFSTTGLLAQQPGAAQPAKPQAKPETPVTKPATTTEAAPEKPRIKSSTDEDPVVTHHHIAVDGKELKYTATAGLMPIKDSKGETEARIFYIAYTLDDPPADASRPLMFSFNGGPGSASVWLHLGTLAAQGHDHRRARHPSTPLSLGR